MEYKDKVIALLNSKELSEEQKEKLGEIFPELKESEGKRTRKALIKYFTLSDNNADYQCCGVHCKDIVAWLEKQGERSYKIIKGKNYFCVKTHNYAGVEWIKGTKYYASDNYTLVNQGCECYCPEYSKEEHNNLFKEVKYDGCVETQSEQKSYGQREECVDCQCNYAGECKGYCGIKQGEQNHADKIEPIFNVGDKIQYLKGCGTIMTIEKIENGEYIFANNMGHTTIKDGNKWELVEQKPVDTVEPKFKVGQWIVWQDKCCKVNYNGCGYKLVDQNGLSTSLEYGTVDENAHLWDITKDAKDGDALVNQDGEMPYIFKECKDNHIYCYCGYTNRKDIFFDRFVDSKGEELHWLNLYYEQVYPATKEQRDLLFSKMKEAGYEWDADKKELKKIELKPTWSEDDLNFLTDIEYLLRVVKMENRSDNEYQKAEKCIDWLKSLKDRILPQPKQEWSEEDEKIALSIEQVLNCASLLNIVPEKIEKIRIWLKSLRPQNRWKPSDEQMIAIQEAMNIVGILTITGSKINSLYQDLKKLKE